MDADTLVPLFWPEDYLQADLIRQALEGEGIPCLLEGENQASIPDHVQSRVL